MPHDFPFTPFLIKQSLAQCFFGDNGSNFCTHLFAFVLLSCSGELGSWPSVPAVTLHDSPPSPHRVCSSSKKCMTTALTPHPAAPLLPSLAWLPSPCSTTTITMTCSPTRGHSSSGSREKQPIWRRSRNGKQSIRDLSSNNRQPIGAELPRWLMISQLQSGAPSFLGWAIGHPVANLICTGSEFLLFYSSRAKPLIMIGLCQPKNASDYCGFRN